MFKGKKSVLTLLIMLSAIIIIYLIFYTKLGFQNEAFLKKVKEEINTKISVNAQQKTPNNNPTENKVINDNNAKDKDINDKKGEKDMIIGEKKIALYVKQAVIGMRLDLRVFDAGKEDYANITYYQVFEMDKPISSMAKIDSPALLVVEKNPGDIVEIRLYDVSMNIVKNINIKLEQMN